MYKNFVLLSLAIFCGFHSFSQVNSLDPTFANGGIETGYSPYTYTFLVQQDGKILMAGGNVYFSLLRFNKNGLPDSSFGNNGSVFTPSSTITPGTQWAEITSLAQQQDGKILAAGICGNLNLSASAVPYFVDIVRYNTDGSIDSSFGRNGVVRPLFADTLPGSARYDVFTTDGGKILISKTYRDIYYIYSVPLNDYPGIMRFDSMGRVDSSFGTNGVTYTPVSLSPYMMSATPQPDGKILFSGADSSNFISSLIRYTPSGFIDSTFGTNGIASIGRDSVYPGGFGRVVVQPNGDIIASKYIPQRIPSAFDIYKFKSSGITDSTFGQYGHARTPFPSNNSQGGGFFSPTFLGLFSNGEILAGTTGMVDTPTHYALSFVFTRYTSDGVLDNTFGVNGILIQQFTNGNTAEADYMCGLAVTDSDRFVTANLGEVMRFAAPLINVGVADIYVTDYSIYPNPATDRVTIAPQDGDMTSLQVSDLMGQIMYTYDGKTLTDARLTIDTHQWPQGLYVISGENAKGRFVQKMVKE